MEEVGELEQYTDQNHHVAINLYDSQFDSWRGEESMTVTIGYDLHGKLDESLGFTNVRIVSCRTTLPTSPPTTATPTTIAPTKKKKVIVLRPVVVPKPTPDINKPFFEEFSAEFSSEFSADELQLVLYEDLGV